jgi:hypothetical protein|uniref:Uncharacterized protein n=1 Tax=Siphoviridae sp. ct3tr1 TaxID=2827773 RepID=A0A8S5TQ97_9CAUD|nr:MAG TPA: hypothetical protein [Siphoviridae sp. ct3tr1]DAK39424.1 MAG TPA: hypothetical protein [Caudoviricetes sp.]DAW44497.1 MAG TPA: hypothetical protein [Caudoviricetes sp.]
MEDETLGLFLGYLVVYFLTLIFLVVIFDWGKSDVLKLVENGLIFLFLPLVFVFVLGYDFINKIK